MEIAEKALIEGLSYAIDIAEKSYFSHSKHVAYIAIKIAKKMKVSKPIMEDIYYASLIHDIGAGKSYEIRNHSEVGAEMVGKLMHNLRIERIIRYHHETLDGLGPYGLQDEEVPLEALIISLANTFDSYLSDYDQSSIEVREGAKAFISSKEVHFGKAMIDALDELLMKPYFLLDYYDSNISHILEALTNDFSCRMLGNDGIIIYAELFAHIIDSRNPFTLNHSKGIANKIMRYLETKTEDEELLEQMYIAALLHDIGKLYIDNEILNKNGQLAKEERFKIDQHTYYTKWILDKIPGFENISIWAANHHEKLNGKGYPFGKTAEDLDDHSRLMAIIDIYQALTEDRPYRLGMSKVEAWKIIDHMAERNELDKKIIEDVKQVL